MNFGPALAPTTLKRVSREIQQLSSAPPQGIRVVVNESNITDVQAFILGPEGTPYAGGCFRIKLLLGTDFPRAPPKGVFITKIFHPNVSSSGEICVNTLKKDWTKDTGISHILLTIKCLLIAPNAESALNEEAGKLLLERYEEYAKHAQLMTSIHAIPKKLPLEFDIASNTEQRESHTHLLSTPPLKPTNTTTSIQTSPSEITLSPLQLTVPGTKHSNIGILTSAIAFDAVLTFQQPSPAPLSEANVLPGPPLPVSSSAGDKLLPLNVSSTLIGKKRVASQNMDKGFNPTPISSIGVKTSTIGAQKKNTNIAKRSLKRL